jgi:hypothetical protein
VTTILIAVGAGVAVLLAGNVVWAGLVWERGIDPAFVVATVLFIVLAAVTMRAYRGVRRWRAAPAALRS